jgi:hypothetical protein
MTTLIVGVVRPNVVLGSVDAFPGGR